MVKLQSSSDTKKASHKFLMVSITVVILSLFIVTAGLVYPIDANYQTNVSKTSKVFKPIVSKDIDMKS